MTSNDLRDPRELDDLVGFTHGHPPVCTTICRSVEAVLEGIGPSVVFPERSFPGATS